MERSFAQDARPAGPSSNLDAMHTSRSRSFPARRPLAAPVVFTGFSGWAGVILVLCLTFLQAGSVSAKEPKRPLVGQLITIYAPHSEQLELVFDEVELDWSGDPSTKGKTPAALATEVAGATLKARDSHRAVFDVSRANDVMGVHALAMALKAANPGAEAHPVLYEPGRPKSTATRRLLTREVALLLEPGEDPRIVIGGLPVGLIRQVPGVPDGYVVEAADAIAALDLADALRQRSGIRSAYPLLRRTHFPR